MPTGGSSPSTPRLLLRVQEASEALAISRTAIYQRLRAGEIQAVHIGRLGTAVVHGEKSLGFAPERARPARGSSAALFQPNSRGRDA